MLGGSDGRPGAELAEPQERRAGSPLLEDEADIGKSADFEEETR
jgi:hypothetical protein